MGGTGAFDESGKTGLLLDYLTCIFSGKRSCFWDIFTKTDSFNSLQKNHRAQMSRKLDLTNLSAS